MKIIGDAFAGHAFRLSGHKKAKKYKNPLTDLVNLIIAQKKAEMSMTEYNQVIDVDADICIDCGECNEVCPMGCFDNGDFGDCGACGMCLDVCPVGAIIVEEEG